MKYCTKCGTPAYDNTCICQKCGNIIGAIPPAPQQTNNNLGTTAFILSLIGFFTGLIFIGILFDIAAIVLSIIALVQSKKHNSKKAFPLSGLIISIISLILTIAFIIVFIFPHTDSKEQMLEQLENISIETIEQDFDRNYHIAIKEYSDKVIKVKLTVKNIEDNYFSGETENGLIIDVYLADKDDFLDFYKRDEVEVLGRINIYEDFFNYNIELKNSYILNVY